MALIEHEVPEHGLVHLLELPKENVEIVEVQIPRGRRLRRACRSSAFELPDGARLISVKRTASSRSRTGDDRAPSGRPGACDPAAGERGRAAPCPSRDVTQRHRGRSRDGVLVRSSPSLLCRSAASRPAVARGFASPTRRSTAPASEPGRLYVVEQRGTIRVVDQGRIRPRPFLDIAARSRAAASRASSRSRSIRATRRTTASTSTTPTRTATPESSSTARTGSARSPRRRSSCFFETQPFANHNGGQLAFGPDGLLYIGLGDGGSGGDPNNNGQTFTTRLGEDLEARREPRGAEPVLVAYGLRNPWRFSFDRATGDLYIGDVGQSAWEEIDYVRRGRARPADELRLVASTRARPYDTTRTLDRRGPARPADPGLQARRRLLGHRRLRLPRQVPARARRALLLRRLLLRVGLEPAGARRQGDRGCGGSASRSRV